MVVGVILAGGYGKRLKPITDYVPKPLVEIKNGYTILDKQLLDLKYAGIKDVYLLVGYRWEKIKERYGNNWRDLNIYYLVEDKPQGTLFALRNAFKNIQEDSIVRNGDVVADFNIKEIINYSNRLKDALITITVIKMRSPYGIIHFKDNKIISFLEKPLLDYYINAGVYYIKKEAYELFEREFSESSVEKTVFPLVAEMGFAYVFREEDVFWQSVENHKDLERVREEYKNRTDKPWGYEKLEESDKVYGAKELYIKKGYNAFLNNIKDEYLDVKIKFGAGYILLSKKKIEVKSGDVIRIPPNTECQITATEKLILYVYPTSHPNDTVRFNDPYNR